MSGGGGIRTPGRLSPTTVFKTVAINHSATPPKWSAKLAQIHQFQMEMNYFYNNLKINSADVQNPLLFMDRPVLFLKIECL